MRLTETIATLASRHSRRAIVFILNFGVAKLAAFIGPLLLARVLDPLTYGGIEYGLSVATFAAGVLSLGIPGALPQMTLLRRTTPMVDILATSVAVPGAISLFVGGAVWAFGGSSAKVQTLALICTVLALTQGALSMYCRTHSQRSFAAWADSIGNLVVIAVGLIAFVVGAPTLFSVVVGTGLCSVALVAVAFLAAARSHQPAFAERFKATVRFGAPVLLQSLSIVWCVVSGRIYLGGFLDPQAVAIYSAGFRIASALLLIHAVLAIAFFARLYAMRIRLYDRLLGIYFVFLTLVAIAMALVFPYAVTRVSLRAIQSVPEAVALFPVILLQVFAWGCIASLELRVARAHRAGRTAVGIAVIAAGFAIIMLLAAWNGILTVDAVAWLSALQMVACVLVQLFVLWRRGLRMPHTLIAFTCGVVLIGAVAIY